MGKMSRRKGHGFERIIANKFGVIFPGARRQLEYHASDAKGIDLQCTGLYRVQCKRGRRYSPITAIEEIQCDEFLGDVPVLVTQGDRKKILAVLPLDELLRLIQFEQERINESKD